MNFIYHFTFIAVSLFILIKSIFYGIYEFNSENNKSGGIAVICFSVLVVVFVNVIVFFRWISTFKKKTMRTS